LSESSEIPLIQIINDPYSIQKCYQTLISSAKRQIMLFLPTNSAYRREEKIGIFDCLQAAARRGLTVRLLLPSDGEAEQKMRERLEFQGFEVRSIRAERSVHARSKILIVDNAQYLMMELKDDTKVSFVEAVGSAIFSNSRSTILSYITMFDSLWVQAELYEKLEAHDKLQREFINIAAHELRTPVQPLRGLAEVLMNEFENQEKQTGKNVEKIEVSKADIEMVMRNTIRLERLTNDILELSRIESNTLKLKEEIIDLNEKLADVVKDERNAIPREKKENLKIIFERNETSPLKVRGDRSRLFEVLSNLIGNAIKFTDEGTVTITAQRNSQNQVVVTVKDTGKGIDPEIMPRLFGKFATKSDSGTGLGLYLSKKIVEAHGGRIWAENNDDGSGATFGFTLPVIETANAAQA
jgi:two-component system sensor histidine kinase VicK